MKLRLFLVSVLACKEQPLGQCDHLLEMFKTVLVLHDQGFFAFSSGTTRSSVAVSPDKAREL